MAIIDQILARAGYVKLSDYGLSLAPDGRIVSLHVPVETPDGLAVGWRSAEASIDDALTDPADFAAALSAAAKPSTPAVTKAAPAAAKPATKAAPAPAPAPKAKQAALIVEDDEAEPDDEEWEWQLALARAKVAAEEAERAAKVAPRTTIPSAVVPPSARPPVRPTPPPAPPTRTAVPPFVRAPIGAAVGAPRPSLTPRPTPARSIPPPAPRAATQPGAPLVIPKLAPLPRATTQPGAARPAPQPAKLPPTPTPAVSRPAIVIPAPDQPLPEAARLARGTGPVTRSVIMPAVVIPPLEPGDDTSEITADVTDLAVGDVTTVDRANAPAEPPVYARSASGARPLPRVTRR